MVEIPLDTEILFGDVLLLLCYFVVVVSSLLLLQFLLWLAFPC
jgi:hypothetical protein